MGSTVRRVAHNDDDDGDDPSAGAIKRRDPLSLSLHNLEEAGLVSDAQSPREHRGKVMSVSSQLVVGVDQRICLSWSVPNSYYADGYRVMGFRRTDGFAPEANVKQLEAHGAKIIDARSDAAKEEILGEGEYFYTFLLFSKVFFGCFGAIADIVQFSERVPGARHAITRLEETHKARGLIYDLLKQSDKIRRLTEKGQQPAADEVDMVQAMLEQTEEIERVKQSPGWKKLSPDDRKFIIGSIRDKYRKRVRGRREREQ